MIKKKKIIKKLIVLTLSVVVLLSGLTSVYAEDDSVVSNDFKVDNGVLVEYTGTGTEVTIPDGIVEIGVGAFEENTIVERVIIPEGVTYISPYAFYGCTALQEVVFPSTIDTICENAFWESKWLEDESNKDPLVVVNNILIDGRKATGDVTIPDGIVKIGPKAFVKCQNITSVEMPSSVKSISHNAFDGCTSLVDVTIGDQVTYIGESSFQDCVALEEIIIPDSVREIDICAFSNCRMLGKIEVPNSVSYLGDGAFRDCESLKKVVIPSSVTEIGENLFGGTINDELKLFVEKNSCAEQYAVENNLVYELYEMEETEDSSKYEEIKEIILSADETAISAVEFSDIIIENVTKDVVIKSNNSVTFTFAKGTMSAVEGMENYDFGTSVVSDFASAGTMSSNVTANNFVTRINFNYSGKLPATASIKIFVGAEYDGSTLYYSKIVESGFTYITSAVVDAEGYIVVAQDSCSDYVLTTEKLDTEDTTQILPTNEETPTTPKTGDTSSVVLWMMVAICGLGCVVFGLKSKRNL